MHFTTLLLIASTILSKTYGAPLPVRRSLNLYDQVELFARQQDKPKRYSSTPITPKPQNQPLYSSEPIRPNPQNQPSSSTLPPQTSRSRQKPTFGHLDSAEIEPDLRQWSRRQRLPLSSSLSTLPPPTPGSRKWLDLRVNPDEIEPARPSTRRQPLPRSSSSSTIPPPEQLPSIHMQRPINPPSSSSSSPIRSDLQLPPITSSREIPSNLRLPPITSSREIPSNLRLPPITSLLQQSHDLPRQRGDDESPQTALVPDQNRKRRN